MTIEATTTPFRDFTIGVDEEPAWHKGEFLRANGTTEFVGGNIYGPEILERDYINQYSANNFIEFENERIVNLTGYHADVMRPHGCGISSVYMALEALCGDQFKDKFPTVGQFAIATLKFHRNDYTDDGIRKIGTPVFNLQSGWYHDALVYSAKNLGRVDGFRVEDIASFEDIGSIFQRLIQDYPKVMAIVSVKNEFWRVKTEESSVSKHMVVVNGFKFSENGTLQAIRVVDSYVSDRAKINEWINVDERVRNAFTGKALFFYK